MNLTELLDQAVVRWPSKAAIIDGDQCLSYGDLAGEVAQASSKLREFGLSFGNRVGLLLPNSSDYIVLTFALWRIDAVVVPVPTECTEKELSEIATTMGLQAILSHKPLQRGLSFGNNSWFIRLSPEPVPDNHGLNIAFIRFTSGTTNARKGVVLCHESVSERVASANRSLRIGPNDTVMWSLPMSHHFLITIVLYLSQGSTIVLFRQLVARAFLETVNRRKATILYGTPFQFALLARDNSEIGLSSVRLAVSTTCPLPQDVAEDFLNRFNIPLSQALGVIELGLVTLNSDAPVRHWNSVGRPAHHFQVRIIAPDNNGWGEVAVRGPGMFDAYATPWLARAHVLQEGWFHTGDIGRLDADGFLFLVGRKSAVINLAGRKVFPEEIEAVLNRHPAIIESRAYGCSHPHLGETVEAEIILAQSSVDLQSVRDFCRASLAPFKIPSRLRVVDELPRTSTAKIRRPVPVSQHD
jgi:acyl-CoA synthetase (AMP-forming)/AMP-acid ligase II